MRLNGKIAGLYKNNRHYILLLLVFVFSAVLLQAVRPFYDSFNKAVTVNAYLAWHNLFELMSILISFAVFFVAYYTYDQTSDLRAIFLGSVFFLIGAIDLLHTLSFKGMPDFFGANTGANRATTFWIIARLFSGLGFLIAALIPADRKSRINRLYFVVIPAIISAAVFISVSYCPQIYPQMYIEGKGLTEIKIDLEYVVMALCAAAIIVFMREYKHTKDFLTVVFSGSLLLRIFSELAFTNYSRVYDIYNYLGHVYKILAYFIVFRVVYIYSVQKPYLQLSQATDQLKNYADNLDKIVEQRTNQIKEIYRKLLDDLEYARDMQRSMLPSELPSEKGVSFHAGYFPAERLSGDFYNIFKLDDENIGLYIGDVSGHGVPAAMLAVFLNQSIKTRRLSNDSGFEIIKPSDVLKDLYMSFNMTNFKEEVYIVMLYGVYNFKKRELILASAGMNTPPILLNGPEGISNIDIKGFPICKFADIYEAEYVDSIITLKQGQKLLFYTDGLVEAENSSMEKYAENRLNGLLKKFHDMPGTKLSEAIEKSIFDFTRGRRLKDDITFFIMDIT